MAGNSYRDEPLSLIHPSSSPITVPEEESFLVVNDHGSQIGSGSFQNEGFLGGDGNSDAEFGFARPDFRQSPLVGTTEMYDRHVFLCYKNPQVWPPRIEAAEFDRLPRLLSAALAARKGDMKREVCRFSLLLRSLVLLTDLWLYECLSLSREMEITYMNNEISEKTDHINWKMHVVKDNRLFSFM